MEDFLEMVVSSVAIESVEIQEEKFLSSEYDGVYLDIGQYLSYIKEAHVDFA